MSGERVKAVYLAETPYTLERAAEVIAGEQSTGTFTAVPGETEALKARHGARIEA
ncbi:putative ribulose 1,5-bisphosphate carboxylase, partial [Paenibacillus sp. 598K]